VFVFLVDAQQNETLIDKTEKIQNDLNPKFGKTILMDYRFEEVQNLKFCVVDVDSNSNKWTNQDFIGSATCSLASIVSKSDSDYTATLRRPNAQTACGEIIISCEEVGDSNMDVTLQLSGIKLDKKDMFGKSDPFLIFSKIRENGTYTPVHKTEVVKNTLNPTWREFRVSAAVLCGGDLERQLKIECFDWDSNSDPDLIGECVVTLRELSVSGAQFSLINPKKKAKKRSYKDSGTLKVNAGKLEKKFSFLEYIRSGYQLNLMVAVDFTASNGTPTFANSLHYINPYQPNQYQQAMAAVGQILLEYDSDKMIPAYLYGAKINGQTHHCFPLNFNATNPEVPGIPGLLAAYQNAISQVKLYGPTNLAPTLAMAKSVMNARKGQYLVLLILTDGVISDFDKTVRELVDCSSLPLSVVIVGVGNADFSAMEALDGDDGVLKDSSGRKVKRDVVQFVPYSQFASQPIERLAAATLREIPTQFTGYMESIGAKPLGY